MKKKKKIKIAVTTIQALSGSNYQVYSRFTLLMGLTTNENTKLFMICTTGTFDVLVSVTFVCTVR